MKWNVARAKERLSEVLRLAAVEPQRIFNRQTLVAAVIDAETFEEFWRWKQSRDRRSIGDEFAELRSIAAREGGWELTEPAREDRPNRFAEVLSDASLRHERSG